MVKDGQLQPDTADEIVCDTRLTLDGKVVHARLRERLEQR